MKRNPGRPLSYRAAGELRRTRAAGSTEDAVVYEVSVASDSPVRRRWYGYDEILELGEQGTDLDFFRAGNAPVLFCHDQREILGRVVSAELRGPVGQFDGSRQLVCGIEFYSKIEESAEAMRKIDAGLLRNLSVGYCIEDESSDYIQGVGAEIDRVIVRAVELNEVSLVSVPADQSVGFGRSRDEGGKVTEEFLARLREKNNGGGNVDENEKARLEAELANRQAELKEAENRLAEAEASGEQAEKNAVRKLIAGIARAFGLNPPAEDGPADPEPADPEPVRSDEPDNAAAATYLFSNRDSLLARGLSEEKFEELRERVEKSELRHESQVQLEALKMISSNEAARIRGGGAATPAVNLNRSGLDFAAALRERANGREITGALAELSQESMNKSLAANNLPGFMGNPNGVFFPMRALFSGDVGRKFLLEIVKDPAKRQEINAGYTRAYSVGSNPSGPHHEVFDENYLIEALVAEAVAINLVKMLPVELTQDLVLVRETGTTSTSHVSETGTRSEETGPTYANPSITWHQIVTRLDITNRALDQSTWLQRRLLEVMRRDLLRGINQALLTGTGSSNQPTGILNLSGLDKVAIGANGGKIEWKHVVDLVTTVQANNASMGNLNYLTTPEVRGALEKQPRFTGSTGAISDRMVTGMDGSYSLNGYPLKIDNNAPKNGTKGTGTGLHTMIYGDWSSAVIAPFSGVELLIDPFTAAETSQTRMFFRQAYDIFVEHTDSFVAITDINPSAS